MRFAKILSVVLLAVIVAPNTIFASSQQPVYEGQRIRIVVGYPPGGSFDRWSRLIARHISRYIPGNPSVIVQNMPGAASLVAANWTYAMPGDGLTMVNFNGRHIVNAILGMPDVKFDPEKYVWLGSPTPGFRPQVLYTRPEIASTLQQFLDAPKAVNLGAPGQGSNSFQMAKFLEIVGANVRVVPGYPGSADVFAAIARKEADGTFINQESAETGFKSFLDDRTVVPIVKFGPDNPGRSRLEVPTFLDLAKKMRLTSAHIDLGKFMIDSNGLAIVYALPPRTPKNRVQIIQKAFNETLQDRKLLEEATKVGFVTGPLSATEIEELVSSMNKAPIGLKENFRKHFQ